MMIVVSFIEQIGRNYGNKRLAEDADKNSLFILQHHQCNITRPAESDEFRIDNY